MNSSILRFTSRIAGGYLSFFKSVLRVIAFSLAVAGIATLVTLPLWYWATTHRASFTTAVLIVLAAAVLFLVIKQIRSNVINQKNRGYTTFTIILSPLKKIGKILAAFILLYITLIVFVSISVPAGVVSALLTIALVGMLFFASR